VFIVDEIHMLSTKAFNSLLKTLEEPPQNTVFIFATTEIKKVPATILSRCQKFHLRSLADIEIASYLKVVCTKEQFVAEDAAIDIIAKKADGSMRDALSLLDQAIINTSLGSDSNKITESLVKRMLNIVDLSEVRTLFDLLAKGDLKKSLSVLDGLLNNTDELAIVGDMMEIINDEIEKNIANSAENHSFSTIFLVRFWQILVKGLEELNIVPNKKMALSVIFVKLCTAASVPSTAEIIELLENKKLNEVVQAFKSDATILA
jgi:DNA polymerase-3 subunit gamma/tau